MLIRCQRCGDEVEADARFCGHCGATIEDPNIGRIIGRRYVLHEKIGAGSLGVVYRAEQKSLGRKLAIKLLPADAHPDPQLVARFRREGELLCRLRSSHTVTTYEFDKEEDGTLYIAMELSPGKSLAEVLLREGPLQPRRVLQILIDLCDSLIEAHELGVVHRDLKPENIMIEMRHGGREIAKVLDFGLAKLLPANTHLSAPGQTIGSLEFSSPELLLHQPIDGRSDLYALGVLGYLLVTGVHPFHDVRNVTEMIAAHVQRIPPPPSLLRPEVSSDIDAIFGRLMAKEADRRFPDASALAALLGIVVQGVPQSNATIREPELGTEDTEIAGVPKRDD